MSARQPFVPQRSVTDHPTVPKPANESFNDSQQEDLSIHNKPFNLTGFRKPKHKKTTSSSSTLQSRKSFEGIQRPLQVKFSKVPSPRSIIKHPKSKPSNPLPSQNQNQSQNPHASPFFPTSSSTPIDSAPDSQNMSSNSASVSRIATPFKLASRVNSFANSGDTDVAHIPGPTVNNNPFVQSTLLAKSTSQVATTAAAQSLSLLEKIPESTEDPSLSSPFSGGEGENADRNGFIGFSLSDAIDLNVNNTLGTSGRSKRSRPEDEEDIYATDPTRKRRKGDGKKSANVSTSIRGHSNSNSISNTNFSPLQASSQARGHHYRESTPRVQDIDANDEQGASDQEQEHEQHENQIFSRPQSHHQTKSLQQPPAQAPITLNTIFNTDLDAYVVCHIEQHEAECKRWAECSTEDWVRGADELAAEYADLLEFAKTHMTAKLTVFTTLKQKVKDHISVLGERAVELDDVQKRLLKDGTEVLV